MNRRKKALLCFSLLTSTILGGALLGSSSAWADHWGHRDYYRRPYYQQANYWGGYRPRNAYANPWGGRAWGGGGGWGYHRRAWNPGWNNGWNRGGWGGQGWNACRERRGWW